MAYNIWPNTVNEDANPVHKFTSITLVLHMRSYLIYLHWHYFPEIPVLINIRKYWPLIPNKPQNLSKISYLLIYLKQENDIWILEKFRSIAGAQLCISI